MCVWTQDAALFALVHKMDLVPEDRRDAVFSEREAELKRLAHPMNVHCFRSSIWDETLYKAWYDKISMLELTYFFQR